MILYFSATGNSRFVAESIAAATGDAAVDFASVSSVDVREGERLGFVAPTYFWSVPNIVADYLRAMTLQVSPDSYVFFVSTFGMTPGRSGQVMKKLLADAGVTLSATFGVQMVDNWTPVFDVSDETKVAQAIEAEKPQVEAIIRRVEARECGTFMPRQLPSALCYPALPLLSASSKTSHFHVEDSCTGCGFCARKCPARAIEMADGKPAWVKDTCAICLGCLHRCPEFAIQYGSKTKAHGQYQHPRFRCHS